MEIKLSYITPSQNRIRWRRWLGIATASVAATAVAFFYLWPSISFYQLTGHFKPISQVDTLSSPVAVTGWSENGLLLTDGRLVQLPGFTKLPKTSAALTLATSSGVEIAPDGHIYGLIRIIHWCGNDPVQNHIARLDLADMLTYLREGQPTTKPSDEAMEDAADNRGGDMWQNGWNISDYLSFKEWCSMYARRS
jgi:hypothetical protein